MKRICRQVRHFYVLLIVCITFKCTFMTSKNNFKNTDLLTHSLESFLLWCFKLYSTVLLSCAFRIAGHFYVIIRHLDIVHLLILNNCTTTVLSRRADNITGPFFVNLSSVQFISRHPTSFECLIVLLFFK